MTTRTPTNYSAASNKGLCRSNNEDNLSNSPNNGLWLIADGMGGHEAGEVASAIVVDVVEKKIVEGITLPDAIQSAHESVLQAVKDGVGASGMGSTVVALHCDALEYEVAWVGDSRAYLWTRNDDGGSLERLSTDHSYVQLLLATGAIDEAEVENHPDKNVITQCIGSQDVPRIHVDVVKGQWEKNQWILLCSDGLTDEVNDELLAKTLCAARSVNDAVNSLLNLALDNGGRDNITLQIIETPLAKYSFLSKVWDWLPSIFGNRLWDSALYGLALTCFLLLSYWILN